MAEGAIELIRLEGGGTSVVLRVEGRDQAQPGTEVDALVGEFAVDTPFVTGTLATRVSAEDLRQWQQALDALDTGQDIAWRDGTRNPRLAIELDEDDERCHVTLGDHATSPTVVTVTVPLGDAWFDDAYRRLDRVWETLSATGGRGAVRG